MRVACIGEAMVELSLDGPNADRAQVGYAGDALNTAIYLKRAAPALGVDFVTRLGRDAFSDRLLASVRAEGLGTDAVTFSKDRNVGLYAIATDAAGERSFTYWRSQSAAREMFQTDKGVRFDILADYDVLCLSAITIAILPEAVRSDLYDWIVGFRRKGGRVIFDSNYRPALWPDKDTARRDIRRMWESCDIALPSVDDEMAIFGDADAASVVARLKGWGVSEGALKCGPGGPVSLGEPVEASYPPAAKVVDTTAAGDSFNAGYLAARLTGESQARALRAGHDLASMVIGVKGAIAPR